MGYVSSRAKLGIALGISSFVSVGLFFAGAKANHNFEYAYLMWNLFLAWIPLGLALWLESLLRTRVWSSWLAMLATLLWLVFLPNSFYVMTDFVHLTEIPRVDIVFDVVMFGSYAINGLILGYTSLFLVHGELRKRLNGPTAGWLVAAVLAISSFAIYIGRDLRWNTWDVIVNPASLLFDVSDRIINAGAYPSLLTTTLSFLIFLGSLYVVIWYAVRAARPQKS